MGIMDYLPQFGDNTTQDVSGLPQDDTMMQLELQRRMKMAQALQQQAMPEGQMVSGHYVAPSWTQYAAKLFGDYQGKQNEQKAIKQYSDYQQSKSAKLADLLAGKEVQSPMDYADAGGMPGVTQTTRQPYNQQEFLSKAVGVMPELAPKLIESQIAQYGKEEQPLILSEGAKAYKNGQLYAENPKAGKNGEWKEAGGVLYQIGADGQPTGVKLGQPKPEAPKFQTFTEGNQDVNYQVMPDGTLKKLSSGPHFKPESDSAKDTLVFNRTNKLRDDFSSLPEVKAWNVIQPTLVAARQAAKDTTGGSDLNLVYAMGKIMDPNSVVREGELQMAGNTGSLGQKIQGYYKSVANGGRLPPNVKQDLLNQIESRSKAQENLYTNTKKKYTEIAKRNNLNPEDLFVEGITAPASKTVNFGDLK